jgi:hypothetical protein
MSHAIQDDTYVLNGQLSVVREMQLPNNEWFKVTAIRFEVSLGMNAQRGVLSDITVAVLVIRSRRRHYSTTSKTKSGYDEVECTTQTGSS